MNTIKTIEPWIYYFKAFLILLFSPFIIAQNTSIKKIEAEQVNTVSIDGNQFFLIDVMTSNSPEFEITSVVDGEYENDFQIISSIIGNRLNIKLEPVMFSEIKDDKRNAHKVIAATLHIEIPEGLNLDIESDIASVELNGHFNQLVIQLSQGYCILNGDSKQTTINTIDGDINIITSNAKVKALSNKGTVNVQSYELETSEYNLKSVHGNISVKKPY